MAAKTLTESDIVDAALRVIRRDGADKLSMRALSRELGVSAMAAYHYVANKEELLDLVAARALADVTMAASADLEWHVRLRMLVDRIQSALRHHRGVGEFLLERINSTQRHVMRAIMELLDEAGFEDREIVTAYALIHTYLFGRYRVMVTMGPVVRDPSAPTDPTDVLSRIGPLTTQLHGRDYYEFGIDTLILGLRAQLAAKRDRAGLSNTGASV